MSIWRSLSKLIMKRSFFPRTTVACTSLSVVDKAIILWALEQQSIKELPSKIATPVNEVAEDLEDEPSLLALNREHQDASLEPIRLKLKY